MRAWYIPLVYIGPAAGEPYSPRRSNIYIDICINTLARRVYGRGRGEKRQSARYPGFGGEEVAKRWVGGRVAEGE